MRAIALAFLILIATGICINSAKAYEYPVATTTVPPGYYEIIEAERIINKAKSLGLSPDYAESLLSKAKQEYSEGNYRRAAELAKEVLELEDYLPELEKEINKAYSAIDSARSLGLNPVGAVNTLERAKREFSKGNYYEAIELAKKAYELVIDVDQDGVPNKEDFAPTINNDLIYIWFIAIVPLVGVVGYLAKKRSGRSESTTAVKPTKEEKTTIRDTCPYCHQKLPHELLKICPFCFKELPWADQIKDDTKIWGIDEELPTAIKPDIQTAVKTNRCPHCGYEIIDTNARFCPYCGGRLK